ncbi:hypothetical protein RhiJN_12627 [Ceratobasidium sp. AG-Ba]|nr:hypothetical protein RhiJN_12627 [Ceratobasidium sp. AG-Ba]
MVANPPRQCNSRLPPPKAPKPVINASYGKKFKVSLDQMMLKDNKGAKAQWDKLLNIIQKPAQEENLYVLKAMTTMANVHSHCLDTWVPKSLKTNHWLNATVNKYAEAILLA